MKGLKKNLAQLFKKTFPYLFITGIVFLFFRPFFFSKKLPLPGDFIVGVYYPWLDYKWGFPAGVPVKNPMTTDVVSLIFPEQTLAVEMLKDGQWPLWNPYILTGTPLFANLQAAPFSPTNFLYFIFDKLTAWSWQIIAQHVLAGIFMYLFLRFWRVSVFGAVFGGVGFSFFGFNTIFSQWNGHTLTSAFIPLSVLLLEKILRGGNFFYASSLAIVVFLQLLSGYPQTSLYTVLLLAVVLVIRFYENRALVTQNILWVILGGILCLGLSAVQILPARELWGLSQRPYEPHPFEWAFLPWVKIITLVVPDFFGNHATYNYWGPQDYTSNTLYVGVIGLILVLTTMRFFKSDIRVRILWLVIAIVFVLAFPTWPSLYLWKNDILGMRAASAHRITILANFAMSGLIGIAVDKLVLAKKWQIRMGVVLTWILMAAFGFGVVYLYIHYGNVLVRGIPKYVVAMRNMVFPGMVLMLGTGLLILGEKLKMTRKVVLFLLFGLMTFEMLRFFGKFTPFTSREFAYPQTPVLKYLVENSQQDRVTGNRVIPVNLRTPFQLYSLEGYETIHPLRISQFLAGLNRGAVGAEPIGRYGMVDNDVSHLLDLVGTKYYLELKRDERGNPDVNGVLPKRFENKRFEKVFEDRTTVVFQSQAVLPRAFVVYDWEVIRSDEEILRILLDPGYPFAEKILVEEEISEFDSKLENVESTRAVIKKYSANKLVIETDAVNDGLLFVSDAHYPGWQAFVDGVEVKIYRADFAFRAVPLKSGKHVIVFEYLPDSFYRGLNITGFTIVFLLVINLSLGILKLKDRKA